MSGGSKIEIKRSTKEKFEPKSRILQSNKEDKNSEKTTWKDRVVIGGFTIYKIWISRKVYRLWIGPQPFDKFEHITQEKPSKRPLIPDLKVDPKGPRFLLNNIPHLLENRVEHLRPIWFKEELKDFLPTTLSSIQLTLWRHSSRGALIQIIDK